jgi:hypothetical protein
MQQALPIALIIVAIIATGATPAIAATQMPVKANAANTCEIVQRSNGQFVRQTAGTAGEISVYVDGEYATYIPRKNRLYYATDDKDAVVRGYDADGIVC